MVIGPCRLLLWLASLTLLSAMLVTRVLLPSIVFVRCTAGMTKQHLQRATIAPLQGLNITELLADMPPPRPLPPGQFPPLLPPVDLAVIAGSSHSRYAF